MTASVVVVAAGSTPSDYAASWLRRLLRLLGRWIVLAGVLANLSGCSPGATGVSLNDQGIAAMERDSATAEALFKKSLATAGSDDQTLASSLTNLGLVYMDQGRYAEAEPLLVRSVAVNHKLHPAPDSHLAAAFTNLGILYIRTGRYPDAEAQLVQALAYWESVGEQGGHRLASAYHNLGTVYAYEGKFPEAVAAHQKALAIREKLWGADSTGLAFSLGNIAAVYAAEGRYASAEPLYLKSIALWEAYYQKTTGKPPPVDEFYITWISGLAEMYHRQGRDAEALVRARQASRRVRDWMLEPARQQTLVFDSKDKIFQNALGAYLDIAAGQVNQQPSDRQRLVAETFEIGQLYHDGTVGRSLSQMAVRQSGGSGPLAALIREQQDAQQAWQQADSEFVSAVQQPRRDPAAEAAARNRADRLKAEADRLSSRIAAEFPGYAAAVGTRPLTVEEVQNLLLPGEAVANFVTEDDSVPNQLRTRASYVWLIKRDSASFRKIPLTQTALAVRVKALRESLDPTSNPDGTTPYPTAAAFELFRDLLGAEDDQLTSATTLLLVPDGPLESLPFSVLVTRPPAGGPADYKRVAWLSRRLATATLPTVSSLQSLRSVAHANAQGRLPFIGFGNPDFAGNGTTPARNGATLALTRGAIADPNLLRRVLPPLPETASELHTIAVTLGADPEKVITGSRASVSTVEKLPLSDYRVIAFATHALISDDLKALSLDARAAEPAIALTPPAVATAEDDGLLRASQVARLRLNADWVVLSACNTAAPDGTPGSPGLSGLAKAFFYAGARTLLVSHWPVLSNAAVSLTTGLFKEEAAHPEISRAEALRRSMMAIVDQASAPADPHPQIWAPFVVAGEGGAAR